MEHLYNPDQMSEREIKETFVARGPLVDRLADLIRHQPDGAGVQHVVLVGPRGMGKTTVLLMVQFAVAERGLDPPWLAVRFPEELYGVTDLAEFWLETLADLSRTTNDAELAQRAQALKDRYPDSEQLQEATLALLREWCRQRQRRLVLLVDNFHMLLSQIDDEQQNAALRNILMNDGFLMIIGAAPSFFKEASAYDEPLYNFFKIERLERLTFDEMLALLRQRALADGRPDFERVLAANVPRLRVLEYFTGGNARLVLMLYRVVSRSDVAEVRGGLDLLLDQVTPYYKDKTEALPSQQRKILDHVARRSGQSHEGVSPSEIAQAVRLSPQVVSAQLKRLSDAGYVEPANLRGRTASYTLSEPLYSLWYQMRFGRDARQRMTWLVEFLKGFYTTEELTAQSRLLEGRFHELRASGSVHEAKGALEYRRWLAEAMDDRSRPAVMESVILGYLTLKDIDALKEQVLSCYQLENLSRDTLDQLVEAGCITPEVADEAQKTQRASDAERREAEVQAARVLGDEAYRQRQFDQSLSHYERALELDPNAATARLNRGSALIELRRYEEALASFDHVLKLNPQEASAWYNRGITLVRMGQPEEALTSLDRAIAAVSPPEDEIATIIILARFAIYMALGRTELAAQDWYAAVQTGKQTTDWIAYASELLLQIVRLGYQAFVRGLIHASQIEEQFFPLARALDYLETGDEALIEKLTPEMRPIVEKVVTTLRPVAEQGPTADGKTAGRQTTAGKSRKAALHGIEE